MRENGSADNRRCSERSDVCVECMENWIWLVDNRIDIPPEMLREIQRSMGMGNGTARQKIQLLKPVLDAVVTP